jgi:hypothetical protein
LAKSPEYYPIQSLSSTGNPQESPHNIGFVWIFFVNLLKHGSMKRTVEHCPSRKTAALGIANRIFVRPVPPEAYAALLIPNADRVSAIARAFVENHIHQRIDSFVKVFGRATLVPKSARSWFGGCDIWRLFMIARVRRYGKYWRARS